MYFTDIFQCLHLHLQSNEKLMTVKLILYVIIKHNHFQITVYHIAYSIVQLISMTLSPCK